MAKSYHSTAFPMQAANRARLLAGVRATCVLLDVATLDRRSRPHMIDVRAWGVGSA